MPTAASHPIPLTASEDKFRTIYDSINDAIFMQDVTDGRILDVNTTACRMFGYSREQLIGSDVGKLIAGTAPYTLETARKYIQLASEEGWQAFEWLARDSTGRHFWVAINLQALRLDGGREILAVVRDIDRRKQAEAGMKAALAEAKALNAKLTEMHGQLLQSEKMAAIGQLAAGVAHELNNPIGFVSSNLGTLKNYLDGIFEIIDAYAAALSESAATGPAGDAVRQLQTEKDFEYMRQDIFQLLAESSEGLQRVRKIVLDLKDFSRPGETDWQWADLHAGLDSTLNIVWNELKYKCTVKKDYGELPQLRCLPSQLNQVFMNLLVNAAHAIPEKGEITIRTGQQGDEVFVAVSDTGSGIRPEHLNRLFDPFFTTKPIGQGTGLGLSLAYGIVQKHLGRIEVASQPGEGTTFTVWLPLKPPSESDTVPPAPTSEQTP